MSQKFNVAKVSNTFERKLETVSTDDGDKYPVKELLTGAKH